MEDIEWLSHMSLEQSGGCGCMSRQCVFLRSDVGRNIEVMH